VWGGAAGLAAAEDIRPGDDFLAYLPMAWIGNSLFALALHLWMGFACNYPEKPETLQRDLRELGPTIALAPPRYWENTLTAVLVRAGDASPLKRRLFNCFRGIAERAELRRGAGAPVPLGLKLGLAIGEVLVYGPLRDQLGLRRARWVYTGGAPLGADTFRFFRAIGVNLKQAYGATELAGWGLAPSATQAKPRTRRPA